MDTIHLKQSPNRAGAWQAMKDLADLERRTLAGMAWVLILEAMEARLGGGSAWEGTK